jgi:hypothetical protein
MQDDEQNAHVRLKRVMAIFKYLQTALAQDLPVYFLQFPDCPLAKSTIFSTQEWQLWSQDVRAACVQE